MQILFVASEVAPYAKTGGLGDVASALPKILADLGAQITVVMPRYGFINEGRLVYDNLLIPFNHTVYSTKLYKGYLSHNVPICWIDAPKYFFRGKAIYGELDDAERFAFFSRASLEVARWLGQPPDVIHLNDWMTSLIPVYLKTTLFQDSYFSRTSTLITIHNIAFQGLFNPNELERFGLPINIYSTDKGIEFRGSASMLKGGLLASDVITTVSNTYANEIQTPEYGFGMEGILKLRKRQLFGILNGVDYNEWNPEIDKFIAAKYSVDDLSGKVLCKEALLARFGLPVDVERPLIAVVSRISAQKGFSLISEIMHKLVNTKAFFILVGSGDDSYERHFQWIRDMYPDRVGIYVGFSDELAHIVTAGADIFLMPSKFEPCGLSQIYSLKYGTVPIVRATGGLEDTIKDFDRVSKLGNGFKFRAYNSDRFLEKIYEALLVYTDKPLWRILIKNAMRSSYSWQVAAEKYLDLYEMLLKSKYA